MTVIFYVLILTQTLITDAHIKDLKSSYIQHTNEELSRLLCVQHLIDTDNHPQEHFLVDRLAERRDCIVHLRNSKVSVDHIITLLLRKTTMNVYETLNSSR